MAHFLELKTIEEVNQFLVNNDVTFLFLSSESCSVCHALWPKVQEMVSQFPQIKLAHIDVDQVKEVAGQFLVFTAPILLLFKGQKEVMREDRFVRMDQLRHRLESISIKSTE
ncbi:thioredoxin family protein [Natribacillus halophilus]|uniref:Thioredoxin n=1 Tax=Natribacillus halophilus TaxID=549003 RepID=A0A1G8LNX2_9BACI|nr:thioredoxin family protein [Natribacillus halophilus]SDI56900.1 Thioredoxin [Natribacillus halophilus]